MEICAHKIRTFWGTKISKPVLESSKCILSKFKIIIGGCQLLKIKFRAQSWKNGQIAVETHKGGWDEEKPVKYKLEL